MLQHGPHLKIHHTNLMTVLTVLSSNSSAAVLKLSECDIEYRSFKTAIATFYSDFKSKTNLIVSNLALELGPCKAAMKYCKKQTIYNLYKRNNSSNGVKCAKEIDHFTEIKSASPLSYHVVAGSNFKVDLRRIRHLQCICRKINFRKALNTHSFCLEKAVLELMDFLTFHE